MWTHKKFATPFKSSYERDKKGERIFVLTNKRKRRIVFESWQAAASLGWRKNG